MLRAAGAKRRWAVVVLALVATVGGCGGGDYANHPGPAPEITVSAVVTTKQLRVSPARLRAGTIELLASNQTATSERIELRSVRLAPGGTPLAQRTGPINPGGTASLRADLDPGTYVVAARSSAIEPATLVVSAARGGDAERLLQP